MLVVTKSKDFDSLVFTRHALPAKANFRTFYWIFKDHGMDIPNFDIILRRAGEVKSKVIAVIGLSNHYAGAFRANPLSHIKILALCLEQIDRLLLMLSQVKEGASDGYAMDAEQILWEVVGAHERLADIAILESLEPIPRYIKASLKFAQDQLNMAEAELIEPPALELALDLSLKS